MRNARLNHGLLKVGLYWPTLCAMTSTVDFEHGGRQEVDRRDDLAGMGSGSGSRPR